MPNRILKESICTSASVDELSWFEESVFYRLIVNCDDYGRFDARTAILKARLFPLKSITEKQVEQALNKLSTVGIVYLYTVDDKPFLQLATWENHQQIRAHKSKYPAPEIGCNQLISDDIRCTRNPIQSNPNPIRESNSAGALSDLEKAINEFKDFRKRIKATMTGKAVQLLGVELTKLCGEDETLKIAIINQSILNGWKGVFPIRADNKQRPKKYTTADNYKPDKPTPADTENMKQLLKKMDEEVEPALTDTANRLMEARRKRGEGE